jgi:hypothetical protein
MNMEHWWNDTQRGKLKYLGGKKTSPSPLYLPHVPHGLADVPSTLHLMVYHRHGMVTRMHVCVCVYVCMTQRKWSQCLDFFLSSW